MPPCAAHGGGAAGTAPRPTGNNVAGTTTIPPGLVITGSAPAHTAVRYALAQLGKPYVFGAAGPNAYDCSGLTMAAWAAAGVALPHLAAAQATSGTPEPTDLPKPVAGDLVLIPGSDGTPQAPGHVGMIVGHIDAKDGRHLYLVQAPETGVPVELTEAPNGAARSWPSAMSGSRVWGIASWRCSSTRLRSTHIVTNLRARVEGLVTPAGRAPGAASGILIRRRTTAGTTRWHDSARRRTPRQHRGPCCR